MNNAPRYLVWLLAGVLTGYLLIICAGYLHASDITVDATIGIGSFLQTHELTHLGMLTFHALNGLILVIAAIPVFVISGYVMRLGCKFELPMAAWVNALGIVSVFLYSALRYDGTITSFLLDAALALSLNVLILTKIRTRPGN